MDPGQGYVAASCQGLPARESGFCEHVCGLHVCSTPAPSLRDATGSLFGFRPLMESELAGLGSGGCQPLVGHAGHQHLRFLSASLFRLD